MLFRSAFFADLAGAFFAAAFLAGAFFLGARVTTKCPLDLFLKPFADFRGIASERLRLRNCTCPSLTTPKIRQGFRGKSLEN